MDSFIQPVIRFLRGVFRRNDETIQQSKQKWDALSQENSRYYIYSNKGQTVTEEEFRESGKNDYEALIARDFILTSSFSPFSDKVIVEIGCGTGRITEFISDRFKHVYGLDISEEMIAQGKERLRTRPNISFYATNGTDIPLPNGSVDFVFSFIVFQHMPSKEVVRKNMSEIERVLKPGGIAKIQVRGTPTKKGEWFSGVSFTKAELPDIVGNLALLKTEGEGERYFWLWLKK